MGEPNPDDIYDRAWLIHVRGQDRQYVSFTDKGEFRLTRDVEKAHRWDTEKEAQEWADENTEFDNFQAREHVWS